jgi:feruloyl-CoA synthase
MARPSSKPPWKPLNLAPVAVMARRLEGGGLVLRSAHQLRPYPRCLGELLRRWAEAAPDRTFLAERPGTAAANGAAGGSSGSSIGTPGNDGRTHSPAGGWRRVSYGAALDAVERIAGALIARGLDQDRPVAILSDNGIDNGLLQLAAMHAGIPVAPISPAYSLLSRDHAKLRSILELTRPGLVYASDGASYGAALATAAAVAIQTPTAAAVAIQTPTAAAVAIQTPTAAAVAAGLATPARARAAAAGSSVELVVSANPPAGFAATAFAELLERPPGPDVAARFAAVGPDTVAKILFTSGSTGAPKGVVNTQRMLCSNQQAIAQVWPFLEERPPVIVDWLPWSHTFGGNHNFNMMLRNGGTLYIDGGRPVPGAIETTVANLREVPSTLHFNVPRGFDMLIPHLASDAALRATFFGDLDAIFYAAAALPQSLWEGLERLAVAATGRRTVMLSAWGSTETAPGATHVHFPIERAGVIGLPLPGTEIKLAPAGGGKLELRVRGPNVTPGYWRRPELAGEAFDEEGFLETGDAGKLAEARDPGRGLLFDGRLAEDFKLTSGTWVHVGELRTAVITAGAPVVQDVVVTGHDRQAVGLLVFPSPAGCRSLCRDLAPDAPLAELVRRPEVRRRLAAGLAAHNAANPASSRRIRSAVLLAELPSIDAGEITDKGYVNQRAVLARRAALVERLHAPGRGGGDAGGGDAGGDVVGVPRQAGAAAGDAGEPEIIRLDGDGRGDQDRAAEAAREEANP